MTPLQITMMLHYYAIAEPYALRDRQHANSSAVEHQRACLIRKGLLVSDIDSPSHYRTTDRGKAYITALREVAA